MKKINTLSELRSEIIFLELKQKTEKILLKQEIKRTMERLKPANLIKNTLSDLRHAPEVRGGMLNTALGLATGFLSKKLAVGSTHNPIKQILGTVLEITVASAVSKKAGLIRSLGKILLTGLLAKRKPEPK